MLEPFEINAQLTNDRIDAVGRLMVEAHSQVIDREEPYDTGWSIGCRSYTWRSRKIIEAAYSEGFEWLGIVDGSLRFIFSVGGTEVNMYRGTSEKPRKNILSRAVRYPELNQYGLFTDLEDVPDLVWSFALETGPEGEVVALQFVGLTDLGEVVALREVPIDEFQAPLVSVGHEDYKPVSLPPASLGIRKQPRKEAEESTDDSQDRDAPGDDANNQE